MGAPAVSEIFWIVLTVCVFAGLYACLDARAEARRRRWLERHGHKE